MSALGESALGVSVLVVSDSHLSAASPEALANWAAVAGAAAALRPELVLHLGDLSLHGSTGDEDLVRARGLLDQLGMPWRAVPGNHDIGDNPSRDSPAHHAIAGERLEAWRRLVLTEDLPDPYAPPVGR